MRRLAGVLVATAAVAGLLAGSAEAASSESLRKELDRVAAAYGKAETDLANTEARQAQLEKERLEADGVVAQRAEALKKRAGYMYRTGGFANLMGQLLTSDSIGTFIKKMHYMSVLGGSDAELVDEVLVNQARAEQIAEELEATKRRQEALTTRLSSQRKTIEERYGEVRKAEEASRKAAQEKLKSNKVSAAERSKLEATAKGETPSRVGSAGRFTKFSLPIAGPTGFANTWGAARSGGRRHQGTDVMAPCGARVVAVADGAVTRTMNNGNGGRMIYLRANNGDIFLYGHLQGYAPGVGAGKRVAAGELLGSNGNSGNASGGPCHVHFEWHPGGGSPVNPYPLLAAAR